MNLFAKNLIIVLSSFFEYGFLGKSKITGVEMEHFWELISYYFSTYSSVQYINEKHGRNHGYRERSLSWLILILNEENVLFHCFIEIFSNQYFLAHYDDQTSYFHKNRPELLEIGKKVYQHKLFINSTLNQEY